MLPTLLLRLTVSHSSLQQIVDAFVAVCGAENLSVLNMSWIMSTFVEEEVNILSLSFWAVIGN